MMKRLFFILTFLLAAATPSAIAFDTPLLTWERGRDQQVVLGGGQETSNWQVQLEGNGITPIQFTKSVKNSAGYVVYSANIPADIPTGAYTVVTIGNGSPRTPVAVIAMVQAQTKTATSSLFDLTRIVVIFAFLTTILGTIRMHKYSQLDARSTQLQHLEIESKPLSFVEKLKNSPLRLRLQFLSDLRPSLLKYLLIQEGEIFFKKSRSIYVLLPILGLTLGMVAAIEIMKSGGILATGLGVFIAVSLLAIIDPVAGIAAIIAFVSAELVAGNVFSVRDLLLVVTISFTWLAPALFSALIRRVVPIDLPKLNPQGVTSKILSSLISAIVGTTVFYFGFLLVSSILYLESKLQNLSLAQCALVFVALMARSLIGQHLDPKLDTEEEKKFYLARINSPSTAFFVNAVIFAFIYIWTQSAQKSLIASTLFAIPYYLIFISMESSRFKFLSRVPRNFFLEGILISLICWLIFGRVSNQPLLSDDAGFWFLFLCSIPIIAHAQISAIWPNPMRKETISS